MKMEGCGGKGGRGWNSSFPLVLREPKRMKEGMNERRGRRRADSA